MVYVLERLKGIKSCTIWRCHSISSNSNNYLRCNVIEIKGVEVHEIVEADGIVSVLEGKEKRSWIV